MKRIDLTLITLLALMICAILAVQVADAVNADDDLNPAGNANTVTVNYNMA